MITENSCEGQFLEMIESEEVKINLIQNQMKDIKQSTDLQDAMWNLSRQENIFSDNMIKAREQVKGKMETANNLYRQMKKKGMPLTKEERDKIMMVK